MVGSGWRLWRTLSQITGWDIPDSKSPRPNHVFNAIGITVDLEGLPQGNAIFSVSEPQRMSIKPSILPYLFERRITSSEAGFLWGRLGHAATQMFGMYGRARLAPLVRRQHVCRSNLNPQLETSLIWWLQALDEYIPRVVQCCLDHRGVVVSYSDGRGADAGVGVAVWHYDRRRPVAAFLKIPREVRLL